MITLEYHSEAILVNFVYDPFSFEPHSVGYNPDWRHRLATHIPVPGSVSQGLLEESNDGVSTAGARMGCPP